VPSKRWTGNIFEKPDYKWALRLLNSERTINSGPAVLQGRYLQCYPDVKKLFSFL